jgi:hypothetical protein
LTIRNRPSLIYYARVLYSFSIRSADGTDRAETGCIALADDGEALAFGKAVIKDMLHADQPMSASGAQNRTSMQNGDVGYRRRYAVG